MTARNDMDTLLRAWMTDVADAGPVEDVHATAMEQVRTRRPTRDPARASAGRSHRRMGRAMGAVLRTREARAARGPRAGTPARRHRRPARRPSGSAAAVRERRQRHPRLRRGWPSTCFGTPATEEVRTLTDPGTVASAPVFSRDGRRLAYWARKADRLRAGRRRARMARRPSRSLSSRRCSSMSSPRWHGRQVATGSRSSPRRMALHGCTRCRLMVRSRSSRSHRRRCSPSARSGHPTDATSR